MKTAKLGLILLISIFTSNLFAQGFYNQTGIGYLNKDSVVPGDTITLGVTYWNAGDFDLDDSTILYMRRLDNDTSAAYSLIRIGSYTVDFLLNLPPVTGGWKEFSVLVPGCTNIQFEPCFGLTQFIFGIGDKQFFWINDTTTVDTTDTINTVIHQIDPLKKEFIESETYYDLLGRTITHNSLINNNLYIFVTRYRGGYIEKRKIYHTSK